MRKTYEYVGETEIIGIIYVAHCPVYVYNRNEHNEGLTCSKYEDDTFPDVESIRLLYIPETDSSPGHYDLLVTQHAIKTCNPEIGLSFENTGEIFQILGIFCHCASKEKHSSYDVRRIFNDKEKNYFLHNGIPMKMYI